MRARHRQIGTGWPEQSVEHLLPAMQRHAREHGGRGFRERPADALDRLARSAHIHTDRHTVRDPAPLEPGRGEGLQPVTRGTALHHRGAVRTHALE